MRDSSTFAPGDVAADAAVTEEHAGVVQQRDAVGLEHDAGPAAAGGVILETVERLAAFARELEQLFEAHGVFRRQLENASAEQVFAARSPAGTQRSSRRRYSALGVRLPQPVGSVVGEIAEALPAAGQIADGLFQLRRHVIEARGEIADLVA